MKKSCTVIIHTRNEEDSIKECIESARLLSEDIHIIDMESVDKTKEIALENHASVYSFAPSQYVEPSREFGISTSKTDWVFILDSDERMTQELADEIKSIIQQKNCTHYKIPRKNIFGRKKWLRWGGWYPDYQIRLIQKSSFVRWNRRIHSSPEIKGLCGVLHTPFIHYFHPSLENMVGKTIRYEHIEALLLFNARKKVSIFTFFRKFAGELYRRLIRHLGFLDGSYGIIESIYQAFSKTITYLFLYEKNRGV
ncbi:MAG TPA: glycosyltransferase family 2 protein [Patescibacteria group bacterium]|nr:glycosyltransferase family 2 protein [Patescibacteria group bacterium]